MLDLHFTSDGGVVGLFPEIVVIKTFVLRGISKGTLAILVAPSEVSVVDFIPPQRLLKSSLEVSSRGLTVFKATTVRQDVNISSRSVLLVSYRPSNKGRELLLAPSCSLLDHGPWTVVHHSLLGSTKTTIVGIDIGVPTLSILLVNFGPIFHHINPIEVSGCRWHVAEGVDWLIIVETTTAVHV